MKTHQTSVSSSVAPSKTYKDVVMTDVKEANSLTPTADIPIILTDTSVAVPKVTTLETRLDLALPWHVEKAQLVAPLAKVYTYLSPTLLCLRI
jgi:hypothetical protein